MNSEEILKKSAFLEGLLSAPSDRNVAEEFLPHYALMKQISKSQSDVRMLKINQVMTKTGKLREDVNKLMGLLDSTSSLAKSLMYLVDSSRLLVHTVNHSTRSGSIPMPREEHKRFLEIIKSSTKVISIKESWKAPPIKWQEVSSVLKSIADTYKAIAEVLDYNLGEHHLLQQNIKKLLEQMSKLEFN